jgi:RNA polymerase sigma factor (sigma-70 family)
MSPSEIDISELLSRIDCNLSIALRRRVICYSDILDLRQDIVLALFSRACEFDPRRASWTTFMSMIIETEIKRFRSRKRWRKYQSFASLDDLSECEHPTTNLYPTSELNDLERHLFCIEFDDAIETLPKSFRDICCYLKRFPKSTTALRLKIPAYKLSLQLRKLRWLFRESKVFRDFIS